MALELATALARHPGTVTDLLEKLAGEPIDADILWQGPDRAGDDNCLGLGPDEETLRRTVLLTGRATGRRFVYADSTIAGGRLPDSARRQLETSCEPIGRILSDHLLDILREPLPDPRLSQGAQFSPDPPLREGAPLGQGRSAGQPQIAALLATSPFARRYRLIIGATPTMIVSEWFLPPATEALAARSPS